MNDPSQIFVIAVGYTFDFIKRTYLSSWWFLNLIEVKWISFVIFPGKNKLKTFQFKKEIGWKIGHRQGNHIYTKHRNNVKIRINFCTIIGKFFINRFHWNDQSYMSKAKNERKYDCTAHKCCISYTTSQNTISFPFTRRIRYSIVKQEE